jgi:hypothetical protein
MRQFLTIACLLFLSLPAFADCTLQKDQAANSEVFNLKTWDSLYSMYLKHGDCGLTGGTAEIFSDEVEKLFSKNWNDITELAKLAQQDNEFEGFVLYHINETWGSDTTEIKENVLKHCPEQVAELCKRISTRIDAVSAAQELQPAYNTYIFQRVQPPSGPAPVEPVK